MNSFPFFNENIFFGILACSVGYFGQDCTEKCKSSCKGCNHVTGLCDAGCQPGWIGDFCEQGKLSYTNILLLLSDSNQSRFFFFYQELSLNKDAL